MKTRPVYVEWWDAAGTDVWEHEDEAKKGGLLLCMSLGHLVHEDHEKIILVQSQCPRNSNFSGRIVIPKSCIKMRRRVTWKP